MGKPAARLGDSTAHGGVIVAGAPTVLICGMPAARLGDMTTCPMAVPAPTPVPHVGGPIQLGSAGVLICGMPAARMGDQALCPPMGPAPIVVGAPTVLIGETGGGAGGGGGGGQGGSGAGSGEGEADAGDSGDGAGGDGDGSSQDGSGEDPEDHFLHVDFVDQGGHPITGLRYDLSGPASTQGRGLLIGSVKANGVPEGEYDVKLSAILSATWSVQDPQVREEIQLKAETAGIPSGTHAEIEVYLKDSNQPLELLETLEASVDGDKVEVPYTFEVDDDFLALQDRVMDRGAYSNPMHVFKVQIGPHEAWSSAVQFRDNLEVRALDDEGAPLKDRVALLHFPNGEIRRVTTDSDGLVAAEDIPPGRFRVSLDPRGED